MPHTLAVTGFVPREQSKNEPLKLSMQRLWLTGRVLPVGARLWVSHEFQSEEDKPVEVIYGFALPRDAALRRFRIRGENFTVDSELRPTADAVKAYEDGIRAGSLASLARQYGGGLVNLTVGNIRPQEKVVVLLELLAGVELHDHSLRLRFPFTLAPAYHAKARSIEAEPGVGEMELPSDEFGDLILPRFAKDARHLHGVGFCLEVGAGEVEEIASPSQTLRVQKKDDERSLVSLARESDLPDRDLVLDIRTKRAGAVVLSGADQGGKGRFAAVIPSSEFGATPSGPRRVVILLDRSGSMQGTPLSQAKKGIEACLAALDPTDQFGLVAFDNQAESFREALCDGSADNRHAAHKFLKGIEARGGTELANGLESAAKLLGSDKGDILILTDGQVRGVETILQRARSTGTRVHCLGIGSASQDRFLAQLAGHTGGVSRFLTPSERIDVPAVELFAAIGRPVAQGVKVSVAGVDGSRIAPVPGGYVYQGTPLLVTGETPAQGEAHLQIDWENGQRHLSIPLQLAPPTPVADTLRLLQGSRIISDVESRYMPAERHGPAGRREASRVAELLRDLGREFGLANSEMALVAVVKRSGDVAGEIPGTRVVPVGMPQETLFASYFGATGAQPAFARFCGSGPPSRQADNDTVREFLFDSTPGSGSMARVAGKMRQVFGSFKVPEAPSETVEDLQIKLAGMLEPDGGMPGTTDEARVVHSLAALFFFMGQGSTRDAGPFRLHLERLLQFLDPQRLQSLPPDKAELASRAVRSAMAARAEKSKRDWSRWLPGGRGDVKVFWQALGTDMATKPVAS